ncbi:nuclear transport factor 2 family protein [Polaromonas sp. P1-6]|nr:nuclear transport factor 2 family protein [Polaromonas sp. P1-6]
MSIPQLQAAALTALAERYFAAVDRKDLAATLGCFAPAARFTIATYSTVYEGRDTAIAGMFERLNERYAQVWHGDFDHVTDVPNQRIASRFRVENITHEGQKLLKNNCNFFRVEGGLFAEVFVYMSGDNSLG